MPSTSEDQAKLMTAACKNEEFRKKVDIPKKVACDYHDEDKGTYHKEDVNMSEELDRIKKLAGIKEPVAEKIELNASDNEHKDARASDVSHALEMAKIRGKMENRDGDDADFSGLFTGVARGEISLDDNGKIAEATFGILKSLEEACGKKHKKKVNEKELEEGSEEKKSGRRAAGSYGRPGSKNQKQAAAKNARKIGKKASKELDEENNESAMFPKGSLERIMVEVIVAEMKTGKNAEEISEELSFSLEHVQPIFDIIKKKLTETEKPLIPRGAPYIENVRFWGLPKGHLEYIMKEARLAMEANPDNPKNITGPGNYADQINDAGSVMYHRKKNNLPYPELKPTVQQEDGLPGYDAWKTSPPSEPRGYDPDAAAARAEEDGMYYLHNDEEAIANILDIKNPKTHPEDREDVLSDLGSNVQHEITSRLEQDNMLWLDDVQIKDIATKTISKHLAMV